MRVSIDRTITNIEKRFSAESLRFVISVNNFQIFIFTMA